MEDRIDFDIDKHIIKCRTLNKRADQYSSIEYNLNESVFVVNKKFDPFRSNGIMNRMYYLTNKLNWGCE